MSQPQPRPTLPLQPVADDSDRSTTPLPHAASAHSAIHDNIAFVRGMTDAYADTYHTLSPQQRC
ncbi:MAG: hypothetical protein AAGC55_33280, partial [Myxococcota bacterium]